MGHHVKTFAHGDPNLWTAVGEWLCSRAVHVALGGPIVSSDATTWFVAFDRRTPIGFATMREATSAIWYDYGFVVELRRGSGVFAALAEARDRVAATLDPRPLRVAVRAERWKHYKRRGWSVSSERGSWIHGIKEAA